MVDSVKADLPAIDPEIRHAATNAAVHRWQSRSQAHLAGTGIDGWLPPREIVCCILRPESCT